MGGHSKKLTILGALLIGLALFVTLQHALPKGAPSSDGCSAHSWGLSSDGRLFAIPMNIRSTLLPSDRWLRRQDTCRLHLLEDAMEWVAIRVLWQEPFPKGIYEHRAISPRITCSSARRVRMEDDVSTIVSGCGARETLWITASALQTENGDVIASFYAPSLVDFGDASTNVWDLVRLQLDQHAALEFVSGQRVARTAP